MNDSPRVPTVDDLRVKLCYICREEERYDSPQDPPTAWVHPCKCTLVAHESCLHHWIKTQQRDFGRSKALKCPQCGDRYETEGFNSPTLRILDSVNHILSNSGRLITVCCAGTIVLSFGAGVYFTFTTYGAFAVREFIGPDLFDILLTENPTRWPWHAWINFPLVPLTLIASRTPLVLWTTSPLVPLLFSWPSTIPVSPTNATATAAATALRLAAPARPQLWPPPPVLVCALFPSIRALYTRLRQRVMKAVVPPSPARPPQPQQPQDQPRRDQPDQQQQQQGRAAAGREAGGGPQRFGLQIREHFDLEIRAHIRVGPQVDPPAPAAAPAAAAGGGDADQAADLPAQEQQDQEQPEQPQQPEPQQPQPQEQADPPAAPMNEEDFAAAAARTIRLTTASFGRLVGGALMMPTIARVMGAALLRLSHVIPLVRAIIAPREQMPPTPMPAAAVGLLGLWNNLQRSRLFGGWRQEQEQQIVLGGGVAGALGGKVLSGLFLTTSQEWAMSDPVWWRNVLGLAVFLVVKDGLKILHLRLAKKELENRRIKNKSFSGVDLAELDLIDRRE
ncbi:hypothetical protein H4582DRAFT_1992420 [Lactarius indigo]|nr:hypothetical protein H4582DRAFT_1992420 [Lactarius indigo]